MKLTTTIHFCRHSEARVCTATIPNVSRWMVNLSLEGLTVRLKLDTGRGRDVNILSISYNKKLKGNRR